MAKHYFDNPSKEFDELCDMEAGVSADEWNKSNQEKRNQMVSGICKEFVDKHIKINWDDFLFELTDNNYHTERAIIEEYMQKKIELLEAELNQYCAEETRSSDGDGDWVEFIENDEHAQELQEQIDYLKCQKVPPMSEEEKKEFLDSAKVDYDYYGKKGTITEKYGDTHIYTYKIPAGPEYHEKMELVLNEFSTGFSRSPMDVKFDYYKELDKAGISESTGAIISICQNGIVKVKKPEKYPPTK